MSENTIHNDGENKEISENWKSQFVKIPNEINEESKEDAESIISDNLSSDVVFDDIFEHIQG